MGSMRSPEVAADVPEDICRNVGTNPIAANIPSPSMSPMAVALTNTGLRKSPSGMMGSAARRSTTTNRTAATIRPAPHAHVETAPQPCAALPPKSVKKIRQVVADDRSTTPSTSTGCVAFLFGRVRVT